MNSNALTLEVEVLGVPEGAEALMASVAEAAMALEGVAGAYAAARLVDDETIREINRDQRGVDRVTDVLSFPVVAYPAGKTAGRCQKRLRREYDPSVGRSFLGDLVISLPRAKEQAETYGHSLSREIGFLTAHAMLHLMGYDHETEADAQAMRALEERALSSLSLTR